ncbi:MAG TPA: hypothetical protein PK486_07185 [Trichococcus flocculiformis]|nr:hypothetical protein [Trichococcus flocculiformis]
MDNQFNPNNKLIQLLLQGMGMEDSGKPEEASLLFSKIHCSLLCGPASKKCIRQIKMVRNLFAVCAKSE